MRTPTAQDTETSSRMSGSPGHDGGHGPDVVPPADSPATNPLVTAVLGQSESARKIDDMLDAVYSETWSLNILWLALSAGPLTYLGLQAGYWFGYGKFAPFNHFVYFAVWTVILGLGGIAFRIYDVISKKRAQARARANIDSALDTVPEIIKIAQNLRLMTEPDPEKRTIDTALFILMNSHSSVAALEDAVYKLTGSPVLADGIRRIEIYRRYGLSSVVMDVVTEITEEAGKAVEALRAQRPQAAEWLELRLLGYAPSLQSGLPRSEGFLERLLNWMETDNEDVLRQRDIEDFFILVYEFLCGREIPLLTVRFRGNDDLAALMYKVGVERNEFRIANAARFSRLKAIGRKLIGIEGFVCDISPTETEANELLLHVNGAINDLCDTINALCNKKRRSQQDTERLAYLVSEYEDILELYTALMRAHTNVEKKRGHLDKALQNLQSRQARTRQDFVQFAPFGAGSGLYIKEQSIRLRAREKIQFTSRISKPMQEFYDRYKGLIFDPAASPTPESLLACKEDLKGLLVETFMALDHFVFLKRAERQRAIEASNAPNFGSLEIGISRQQKFSWGTTVTSEVEDDLSVPAERLFRAMIRQYGMQADERTIEVLHTQFGARKAVMQYVLDHDTPGSVMPELSEPEALRQKPVLQPSWQQIAHRARAMMPRRSVSRAPARHRTRPEHGGG